MSDCNIAVYIDGDSINPNHLESIIKEINLYGNILINNVYADWSYNNKLSLLNVSRHCGITTVQADLIKGKNSTDIKLAVDVVRTLYHFENIDIFYLVVSDYDYRHLIPEIRQYGKKAYCIGSENTNSSLINICDNFTLITNIISNNEETNVSKSMKSLNKLETEISKSIIQLIKSSDKEVCLSNISMMLKRIYKFDIRDTDYNSFKKYILEKYGNILEISNCAKAIVKLK